MMLEWKLLFLGTSSKTRAALQAHRFVSGLAVSAEIKVDFFSVKKPISAQGASEALLPPSLPLSLKGAPKKLQC